MSIERPMGGESPEERDRREREADELQLRREQAARRERFVAEHLEAVGLSDDELRAARQYIESHDNMPWNEYDGSEVTVKSIARDGSNLSIVFVMDFGDGLAQEVPASISLG